MNFFVGGGTFENETVVVAGWGITESGATSPVLLEVRIPIWNQELCVDSFLQRITEYNFCAASYEGGKDACKVKFFLYLIFYSLLFPIHIIFFREIQVDH